MNNEKNSGDVVIALAKNAAQIEFGDIPADVIHATKNAVLDTLGIMLAATGTIRACTQLAELVMNMGGEKECTILNLGGRVPAPMAAFANGAMAHALDFDDINWEEGGRVHPSSTIIPAAFSMADRTKGTSGQEFLTAVVLGRDLIIRMAQAVGGQANWYSWQLSALLGTFAATLTSCKVLGLGEDGMVDALGIAFSQAAGTMELRFAQGSDLGGMYASFPSKAAVLSALMAQHGIKGINTCLEGKAGLFNSYFGGHYRREFLTADLGRRFEGVTVSFKPWPACALSHVYIDGTIQILREHQIDPEQIERATVLVGKRCQTLCEPLDERRKPATILDAKYNIIFPIALALTKGDVVIGDFSEKGIRNDEVLAFSERVTYEYDHQLEDTGGVPPGIVEITLKGGETFRKRVDFPYGHSSNPMSRERLVTKFRDCASYAAKPLSTKRIEKIVELIDNLEQIDDIREIIEGVTPD